MEKEQQQLPRDRWCVESVGKLLADRETSRGHKCLLERTRPVEEQRGSVQCTLCHRWFMSAGGLSVHKRRLCSKELILIPSIGRTRDL